MGDHRPTAAPDILFVRYWLKVIRVYAGARSAKMI
jgi:hypothetical protein